MTQPMELPEAIQLLASLSYWSEDRVLHDPDSACEYAAATCIEARNVIREAKGEKP